MHEIGTALFYEELHISRSKGAWIETTVCIIIGIFCSLSCGAVDITVFGKSFLNFCDFITSDILLPLGAFLTCVFVGWRVPKNIVKNEITNWGTLSSRFYGIWLFVVRFICPICIGSVFLHQLGII